MSTFVIGHKNPDTDSITSAITYSNLKNKLGYNTKAYRLGEINLETKYVLDYFNVENLDYIDNVKIQLKDLSLDKIKPLRENVSIKYAYKHMNEEMIRTQPIVDSENRLIGIVTMRDIAMSLISGNYYKIETSLLNIKRDLEGEIVNQSSDLISGRIFIMAYHYDTVKEEKRIDKDAIVIVGDRYDVIKLCIEQRVKLVILTGGVNLPIELKETAKKNNVSIIKTSYDSYTTAKYINQVNFLSSIMVKDMIKFNEKDYMEDFKEEIQNQPHSNYPIVNSNNEYIAMVNRRHILNPGKKKVILVDHNEYRQSAEGLEEAEILEIVDHHKLGDISTTLPITFRNSPVGSTNTIIYQMYKENNIEVDKEMAGLMLSGIISDTLLLKSPTTTSIDKMVFNELKEVLEIDINDYAMKMFKKGTSLVGQSIEEIFNKDFKEFHLHGKKVGIAQVFTLDIEEVFNRKSQFIKYIKEVFSSKEHYLTLLLITDIVKEGSYLLFESQNRQLLSVAFEEKIDQGDYVKNIVSRKKQILPKVIKAINILD